MALTCVVGAALAAGLTMGLVSIDPMEMEIIVKTEDKDSMDGIGVWQFGLEQSCTTLYVTENLQSSLWRELVGNFVFRFRWSMWQTGMSTACVVEER